MTQTISLLVTERVFPKHGIGVLEHRCQAYNLKALGGSGLTNQLAEGILEFLGEGEIQRGGSPALKEVRRLQNDRNTLELHNPTWSRGLIHTRKETICFSDKLCMVTRLLVCS